MTNKERVKVAILLMLWAVVFSPVYPALVRDWLSHSDNSHGFIVPMLAGYLAWQRKEQLLSAGRIGSLCGGIFLLLSLGGYVISYAGGISYLSRVAMVFSLLGLTWCCFGREIVRILAFPITFLLFMIPVPYSLMNPVSLPLQLFATKLAEHLIGLCLIPVYREGNMLFFVGTQLEVAEACSGIRSIMSLTMIAFLFTSMVRDGYGKKALLIISAVPIAMLANIFRISGTGILAHFFGERVARGFLHEFSGIAVFVLGFVVLFGLFTLISKRRDVNVE